MPVGAKSKSVKKNAGLQKAKRSGPPKKRTSNRFKTAGEDKRSHCYDRKKSVCGMDPSCSWKTKKGKGSKGHCSAKAGVRKKTAKFAGPMMQFSPRTLKKKNIDARRKSLAAARKALREVSK